jgi:alpha-ketoglutarate-dependent taurine dioxygenase
MSTISSPAESLRLHVVPLTPIIGAEVSGVDLHVPLAPALRDELYRLLLRHRVLFWRDQHLNTAEQIAFAEAFGPILVFKSVVPADPLHPGVHDVHGSTVGWHIDASSAFAPPVATVLRAVEVPPAGGDTIWAGAVAAYAGLSEDLKALVDDKYVTHGGGTASRRPIVAHPLVGIHPDTEEKYLYLNLASYVESLILGMNRRASDALVKKVRREYLNPAYQVRFHWSPGTIAMWDNRVVQHTGTADYGDLPRHMKRICLASFHHPLGQS